MIQRVEAQPKAGSYFGCMDDRVEDALCLVFHYIEPQGLERSDQ
jgi:hypothetical protein